MSAKPTGPDSPYQRLRDEGYEVEIRQQHLLIHRIPYVTASGVLKHGTLVCTYVESAGDLLPPDNHQVWFTGEYPCFADGRPIGALLNENTTQELFTGCVIHHRFSNKPFGCNAFTEHHTKMVHYITILSDQAKAIDPNAEARTGRVIEATEEQSVFKYADTASVRAEISMTSARLALKKLAIIGLGGTGAYVMDQVAKTHVEEIHLYDGDEFLQHNAFRSPGAATVEELKERMAKVDYYQRRYETMRRGIVPHPCRITPENVHELKDFDFVFVCVDSGTARALICDYLQRNDVNFIDVGMSVEIVKDTGSLIGTCRVTLSTSSQKEHLQKYVPMMDEEDEEAVYRQNIQIADMNALNAMLAVIKWKQVYGFYQDDMQSHNMTFALSAPSLIRDVTAMEHQID